MKTQLIGRTAEQATLQEFYDSPKPEFLVVYGRRRIGKTYLIKQFFAKKSCYLFATTGIQKGNMADQMDRFVIAIGQIFYQGTALKEQANWFKAFDLLMSAINQLVPKNKKIVIFLDELPWMVTHRSKLLTVIEYFWNQYWSSDPRIKLIICGSSASWIIRKIINNKGGLHNRITTKIQLAPFSLQESKIFLASNGVKLNNKQVTQLYMVTGGIPYYLAPARKGQSATQIIEQLAFSHNSVLFTEFDNLFASLFDNAESYIDLLRMIAACRYGIGQEEIIKRSKDISRGGSATNKLAELEDAGFIISFIPHFNKKRGIYYRILDEYTTFYLKWIEPVRRTLQKNSLASGYWEDMQNSPSWRSWSGFAFESICYKHLPQIRRALAINPGAVVNAWRYIPKTKIAEDGAQIDLLFDRRDDTITLCEIKYSDKPFAIDKQYAKNLLNKKAIFMRRTGTKKQIFISMIVANGLKNNYYADDLINGVVTLDDLFQCIP